MTKPTKVGQMVTFPHDPCSAAPFCITEGKEYEVVGYDKNDTGWPDGCCGTPMVAVVADNGRRSVFFDYRMAVVEKPDE